MNDGVVIDMGNSGAPPVSSDGQPLPPRVRFTVEVNKQEAVKAAKGFSAMGEQTIADRICQTAGIPQVKTNLIERHLFLTGTLTGLGLVGVGYGIFRLVRYIKNRNAMPAVSVDGKVIPMPMRAARR